MKKGFGLVEVMIALMIISVVIIAVTRMFMVSTRTNTYAESLTYASALGHSRLVSLKALAYDAPELQDGWHRDTGNPIREGERRFYVFWSVQTQENGKAITAYTAWDDQSEARDFGSADALLNSGCGHVEFRGGIPNPSIP